jgi:exosome complex RNA-binding protein Rrp4
MILISAAFYLHLGQNGTVWHTAHKEDCGMGTEVERQDTREAMAYDLCNIIDEDPTQETYTKEEIKKMIRIYIATADQK